jgi:hypothetical protein
MYNPRQSLKGLTMAKRTERFGDFRPGVFTSIAEIVCEATADNPIKDSTVLERLCNLHPDHLRDHLAATCRAQIGKRLLYSRHVVVTRTMNGVYGIRDDSLARKALETYTSDGRLRANMAVISRGSAVTEAMLVDDLEEIEHQQVDSTTKKTLMAARVGQGRFRTDVLRRWGDCCSVTGSTTRGAIRASHIKPWRVSNNEERLDPSNGLPLIANLDALFDAGLISFDPLGRLLASAELSAKERSIFGIHGKRLRRKPTDKTAEYLSHHRENYGFNL